MPKAAPLSPKKKNNRNIQRTDAGSYVCPDCRREIRNRGRGSHNKACEPRLERLERERLAAMAAPHDSNSNQAGPSSIVSLRPSISQVGQSEDLGIAEVDEEMRDLSMESPDGEDYPEGFTHRGSDILQDIETDNEDKQANVFLGARQNIEDDLELTEDSSDGGMSVHTDGSLPEINLNAEWMPISAGPADTHTDPSTYHSTYQKTPNQPPPKDNEIRVEYHPRSGIQPIHYSFYDYEPFSTNDPNILHTQAKTKSSILDTEPWRPFSTRLNFEIADFILEASLSNKQTDTLLDLFRRCIAKPESFSLTDSKGLRKIWNAARTIHSTSKFTKDTIQIPYPKANSDTYVKYDMWSTSLWDWCDELLSDPEIVKNFHWNAERVFKFNTPKGSFDRCYSEPWTADGWYEAQSKLPEGGLPLSIILYADKTQLSSFGTAKAYPVMARCGNLPVGLRNGKGVAGGRLVGWLPIINEDAGETGKKGFIDLKRIVWHKSFEVILRSILQYSKTGIMKECGDGVRRLLYPIVMILSADYEEQCYMAAIRGINSAFPCPKCLISNSELSNLVATPILRTSEAMKSVYTQAQQAFHEEDTGKALVQDKILKQYGLRNVENVFWSLRYTDVYSALSWDRLHAYHGGLFSHHLWDLFKKCVESLGKQSAKLIDEQVNETPRWSGLNHFSSIIKTGEYTDGGKYEDMSKIIVFASHNVLSRGATEWGYALLQLIRCYLELDMFSSLLIHTKDTIDYGRQAMMKLHEKLQNFQELYPAKNWNFPKMHTHTHMFDDILQKGATRNYNTKPNEGDHRPLKSFYFRGNFKNIQNQILSMHTEHLVALLINNRIGDLPPDTELPKKQPSNKSETVNTEFETISSMITPGPDLDGLPQVGMVEMGNQPLPDPADISHIILGSALPHISIGQLESAKSMPPQPTSPSQHMEHPLTAPRMTANPIDFSPAYKGLRKHIAQGISTILANETRKHRKVVLQDTHMIEPYQYLKVNYESVVDWEQRTDHLRVNPSFHGHDRHNFVLLQTHTDGFCFAQVLCMFKITYNEVVYSLALVLPMDETLPPSHWARDRDLMFKRVFARSMDAAVVIDVRSITRGALLVRDYSMKDTRTYIVVDVIDSDMWWRIKSIKLMQKVRFTV